MESSRQAPDFDLPVQALIQCHREILEQMTLMEALANEVLEFGAPAWQARRDEWDALAAFFRGPLAAHTLDEDEGLFPLMVSAAPERIERFSFDHKWISQSEQIFLDRFDAFAAEGCLDSTPCREFALEALEIVRHYRNHIREEEDVVFPVAEEILTDEDRRALAVRMRAHRADAAA